MRCLTRRSIPLTVVGLALAALCAPSLMASQKAGWAVVVANNAVVEHGEGDPATAIMIGANIEAGDRITTGEGGALVLTRGEDLVTMAENSQLEIVDPQPSATTLIEQPYGHVEYHVTKEMVPHFQVDAPLLATVVKGTTFSVDASPQKSSVSVSEGRVEAKNRRTGASESVGAGQKGSVETRDRGVDVGNAPDKGVSAPAANSSPSGEGDDSGDSSGKDKDKDKADKSDKSKGDKDSGGKGGKDSGGKGNDGGGNGNGGGSGKGGGNGNGGGKGGGKGKDK